MTKETFSDQQNFSPPDFKTVGFRSLVACGLALITVATCLWSPDVNSPTQAGVVMQLPQYLGSYFSEEQAISPAEKAILPTDTEFARRVYTGLNQQQILCSIVLAGGEKRSIHRPEVCLPGQGWTINSSQVTPVTLSSGKKMEVMKLVLEREVQASASQRLKIKSLFLYWFVGKGMTTPRHERRVFLTSWDRVIHNLNHRWAYVIVNSMVTQGLRPGGLSEEETLKMLKDFIIEITPKFMISEGALEKKDQVTGIMDQRAEIPVLSELRLP
jgi:hypothetical protein